MDQHKLRSLVFEKTGVRIDVDDPIFALVALNEAVLEETVERHVALIEAASRDLAQHARAAGGLTEAAALPAVAAPAAAGGPASSSAAAGASMAADASPMPLAAQAPSPVSTADAPTAGAFSPREWRLLGAAAAVSMLSALLVLGGQALFFKPVPPPAPIVQAKSLTAEQLLAIQNGEKLAKAVQKLDPKARNLVQAEMQK
ncbi:hypothetical protein H3H37_18375 [Duganella sp. LX20W]|uniref:Uncharacterized protein n=1 Tax=Rugamonas brunnea TaxID=2758569 RepID=A0A7W2ID75_9BURK|nr:hypothetical protein [Rugamonas brunnea]MBA5639028.1 hypothetical protein [Rugamonas brunnea]